MKWPHATLGRADTCCTHSRKACSQALDVVAAVDTLKNVNYMLLTSDRQPVAFSAVRRYRLESVLAPDGLETRF